MYIQIGNNMALRTSAIIGIFDLDNTSQSKRTREFLARAEREGNVVTATDELPKAFVLTREFTMDRVYLTQVSAATLEKRLLQAMAIRPRSGDICKFPANPNRHP